jgi:hypothetical protein
MDREGTPAQGVMLVGDGHYDVLGNTTSTPSLIPPYDALGASNPCYDDFYVMVHEGAVLPEIPISRIPVDSRSELLAFTAKLLACETGAWSGTWLNRAVMIADDEWGGYSQNESIHTISAEAIAEEVIPGSVERVKFYLIEYPWPVGENHPEKPEAREALVRLLSEGAAYTVYFGHGSAGQIAHEKIFLPEDVDRLSNGRRLPLSIWATCDVGRFDSPVEDAIGEALVLHPAGGSISSVAATRGTFGESNYALARSLTDSLYNGPPVSTGEALWRAKLVNDDTYVYNNRYYVLFGDLDMQLQRPDGPVSVSLAGDTMRTGEANHLEGDCEVPSGLSLVDLRESSAYVDYTCLGGALITYLRYGGVAFRGSAALEEGHFGLDCFVPVQCVTGAFGRAQAAVPGSSEFVAGALDPVEVVAGDPPGGDDDGPEAEMWVEGYEGVEDPVVTGEIVLSARLTDPSGICFLGGSGRQLTLFVDGQGTDVGDWFSYLQGSSTEGMLSYPVGSLSQGLHSMILWSIDGLGNSSMDTLAVTASAPGAMRITELVAYPSPSDGPMCFSFRVSEDAFVSIGIHTVAGRCIRRLSAVCTQGYNQILWDGLDEDGDPLASGAYPFSVRALATGYSVFESEALETGVLAVIRE